MIARHFTRVAVATALLGAAGSLGACSNGETVDPVQTATATEPGTTTTPSTTDVPTGSPPKRTVAVRNPLGEPANNLLLDGDFELSVSYGSGQYGWRMFSSSGIGEVEMTVETGGLCRSGLTCLRLAKGQILFGRGAAAPNEKGHVMGLYVKLPEGLPCTEISATAIECDTFKTLKKASPEEGLSDGWCHLTGAFASSSAAVCMYIQNSLDPDKVAIVDGAVIGPNDGTVVLSSTPDEPLDRQSLAEMERVRDLIRRTTIYGKPLTVPLPKN